MFTKSINSPSFIKWGLIVGLVVAALVIGWISLPSVGELQAAIESNAVAWADWVRASIWFAAPAFVIVYALVVAFGLPLSLPMSLGGALVLALAYGVVGGVIFASLLVMTGVTLGSFGLFVMARSLLEARLRRLAGGWLDRLRAGFQQDSFLYLLSLRFTPTPIVIQNIVPSLLGMQPGPFIAATVIGFIPGVVAYAWLGASFAPLIRAGEALNWGVVSQLVWPLLALAALSLIPIIIRRLRAA